MRYNQSQGDHTFFIKHPKSRGVTTLLVYVDNIIVIENDLKERKALRCQMENEFEIKDLKESNLLENQNFENQFLEARMKNKGWIGLTIDQMRVAVQARAEPYKA